MQKQASNTALLIIDLQNDFLEGGALAVPHSLEIIPLINAIMPQFEHCIASLDWHPEKHLSFASNHPGKNIADRIDLDGLEQILWPVHCVENEKGSKLADSLDQSKLSYLIKKGQNPRIDSYSAFFSNGHREKTELDSYLKSKRIEELYITGLATDYCVKFTVLDALQLGYKVSLLTEACRAVNLNEKDGEKAIEEMQSKGARILYKSPVNS